MSLPCVEGQLYVQVELSRGTSTLVTWLPNDPRIKVGAFVTMKDVPGKYRIDQVYAPRPWPCWYNQIRELKDR